MPATATAKRWSARVTITTRSLRCSRAPTCASTSSPCSHSRGSPTTLPTSAHTRAAALASSIAGRSSSTRQTAEPVGRLLLYIAGYRAPDLHAYAEDLASAVAVARLIQDVPADW